MNMVSLAYYEKADWVRFKAMIDDAENMHDTWEEWYDAFLRMEKDLKKQGYNIQRISINIYELAEYCRKKGIKNDGKARSVYVSEKGQLAGLKKYIK